MLDVWYFVPFSFSEPIKYFDVIYLITGLNSALVIQNYFNRFSNDTNPNGFFADLPIGSQGEDLFGYTKYAELIARKLQATQHSTSLAIGITGSWGTGKTSFIDLIKRNLESKRTIIINFAPWNSHNPQAIINDFFETLQASLSRYNSNLPRQLLSYSKKLVELDSNSFTKSFNIGLGLITGSDPLTLYRQQIDKTLVKINRQLFIFIDDLDRLDKSELIEVIRLIRNTANFPNTVFIVAYDRNYLIHALKELNDYNNEFFLEKIFQLELTLPYFENNIIRRRTAELLKLGIEEKFHSEIESFLQPSLYSQHTHTDLFLTNIRDVIRFANAFTLHFNMLKSEVVFTDLFLLELIRLKYPAIYEALYKQTRYFIEIQSDLGDKHGYVLQWATATDDPQSITPKIEIYLRNNFSIPNHQISSVMELLKSIFKEKTVLPFSERERLSVVFPSNFHRYFSFQLLQGDLSEIDFSNKRHQSQEEFNAQIKIWVEKGLKYELQRRFVRIKDFDSQEDFEKIICGIFFLANQLFDNDNLVGYDFKDIETKLNDSGNRLSKKFYNGDKEKLRQFTHSIFQKAKPPYTFEIGLIQALLKNSSEAFPLTQEELRMIMTSYFN